MSAGYNGALAAQVVPGLRASSPGLNLYYVDINKLFNDIVASPASYGITNYQAPCYLPNAAVCAAPSAYTWWDDLHPTAAVHALIAQRAVAAIGI
jgi:outer membrane lipase/esterase